MTIPPTTINRYINHIDVLQSLGVKVNPNLPTYSKCPMCVGKLYITDDACSGPWYSCSLCGFAGDSVQLYSEANNMPDVCTTVYDMMQADIKMPRPTIKDINEYASKVWAPRQAYHKFWIESCDRLTRLRPKDADLLHKYNIYTGYPGYIKNLVGCTDKRAASEFGLADKLALKSNALVIPYQDQPGRIRGFSVLHNSGTKHVELDINDGSTDEGLAFMDKIPAGSSHVFAMSELSLGLMLHVKYAMSNPSALPLVCWRDGTTTAWDNLSTTTIIFWAPTVTRGVIDCARRAQANNTEVLIASAPAMNDLGKPYSMHKQLMDMGVTKFLGVMHASAEPLVVALKRYHDTNPGDDILTTLNGAEVHKLRALSTPREQRRIDAELQKCTEGRTIEQDGRVIQEREDGWYYVKSSDTAYRICNAKIILERIFRLRDSNKSICVGKVHITGKDIPFETDVTNIKKRPGDWLEAMIADAGFDTVPIISDRWSKRLWNIAAGMYHPKSVVIAENVGWNDEHAWWDFPQFRIRESKIEKVDAPPRLVAIACRDLKPAANLTAKDLKPYLVDTHANRALWSLMAVLLHNLMAPVKGWDPYTLGLTTADLRHTIIEWLRNKLQLRSIQCTPQITSMLSEQLARVRGLPVIVEAPARTNYTARRWVNALFKSNAIVPVSIMMADAGTLYDNWAFLTVDKTINTGNWENAEQLIPAYLAWVYRNGNSIPDTGTTLESMLASMRSWVQEVCNKDSEVFDKLHKVLSHNGSDGVDSKATAVALVLMKALGRDMFNDDSVRRLVSRSDTGDTTLQLNSIVTTLSRAGFPIPKATALMEILVTDGVITNVRDSVRGTIDVDKYWWQECSELLLTRCEGDQRYRGLDLRFDPGAGSYRFSTQDRDTACCNATKKHKHS